MKRIIISLFVLSLSFSLNSQVDRAGIITKINGREITVRNENPDEPFVMRETLRLLTGDKSVLLQVTFAMQASAKCKLVSGSIGKLKIGSLVYSGGMPENPETNTAKTVVNTNVNSMKIDDFNTFLGFKQGDTIDKAVRILGNPSEKEIEYGPEKWIGVYYTKDKFDKYKWTHSNEGNNAIYIYSDYYSENRYGIGKISINSSEIVNGKTKYKNTASHGTINFLRSKGINDAFLDLFGNTSDSIIDIFGKPELVNVSDEDNNYIHWYKTTKGKYIAFSYSSDDNLLYGIFVSFNQQFTMKLNQQIERNNSVDY